MSRVPPPARLATLLILVVATFIDRRLDFLLAVVIALAIFLAFDHLLPRFLKFLAVAQVPMTIMLVAVWGWVAKAPPGMPMGSDPRGGAMFALLISLRLAVLGGERFNWSCTPSRPAFCRPRFAAGVCAARVWSWRWAFSPLSRN